MALKRDPEKIREWQERSREKAAKNAREKQRSGLNRSSTLKRRPMKRKPVLRGRDEYGNATEQHTHAYVDRHTRFVQAAAAQRVCARCGKAGLFDPHHVVEKSWLKAKGLLIDDPDNALRLCPNCHAQHTGGNRLKVKHLRTENLQYAFRELGASAGSYLRRKYRGNDARLEALEREHG